MDKRHFLMLLGASLALPALADAPDSRPFPRHARRGRMSPGYAPDIYIDGSKRQLSPAAVIFGPDNLTVVPASLRDKDVAVNYTQDISGNIDRVWILSPAEARLPPPGR